MIEPADTGNEAKGIILSKRKSGKLQNTAQISSKAKLSFIAVFLIVIIITALIAAFCNTDFSSGKTGADTNLKAHTGENATDGRAQSETVQTSADQLPAGLRINGVQVTAGELRYALNEVKSTAVEACAGEEKSIGAVFWEENSAECDTEADAAPARSEAERAKAVLENAYSARSREFCADARHPADFALCKAIRLLETQHAAYAQAVEGGQMATGTWEEVISDLRKKNAGNEYMERNGEVVYGIRAYDLPVYVQQYVLRLKDEYVNSDTAPQMRLTEAQIEQHYTSNEWDFGSKIAGEVQELDRESESWDLIRASVTRDLRTRIYYDLLATRIEAMELDFNREALVEFAQNTFTK